MENRKTYIAPEMEITVFENMDVMTASRPEEQPEIN